MVQREIPQVINNYLHLSDRPTRTAPIVVGSPMWYAWLADSNNRSFSFKSPAGTFTARHEQQRNSWYWYAYHKRMGKMRKAYLGKPGEITFEHLCATADMLARQASAITTIHPLQIDTYGDTQPAYLEKMLLLRSLILQTCNEFPGALSLLTHMLSLEDHQTQQLVADQGLLYTLMDQLRSIDREVHASLPSTTLPTQQNGEEEKGAATPTMVVESDNTKNENEDKVGEDALACFTEREREVVEQLLQGSPNRVIAERLVISEGTVKKHVANICGKLGVKTRSQAIAIIFSGSQEPAQQ